jgi:hypothetical protein
MCSGRKEETEEDGTEKEKSKEKRIRNKTYPWITKIAISSVNDVPCFIEKSLSHRVTCRRYIIISFIGNFSDLKFPTFIIYRYLSLLLPSSLFSLPMAV